MPVASCQLPVASRQLPVASCQLPVNPLQPPTSSNPIPVSFHQNQLEYELPGGALLRMLLSAESMAQINGQAKVFTDFFARQIEAQAPEDEEPLLAHHDLRQLEFRTATLSFQPKLPEKRPIRPAAAEIAYLVTEIDETLLYAYCPLTRDEWTGSSETELAERFEKRLHEQFSGRVLFPLNAWYRLTAPTLRSVERSPVELELEVPEKKNQAEGPQDAIHELVDDDPVPPEQAFRDSVLVRELSELLRAPERPSVLLVGPAGAGKTLLARALGRRWKSQKHKAQVYSIGPVRMMERLSDGYGSWHGGMRHLGHRLTHEPSPNVLHVHGWAQLMSSGKTTTSDATIGSGLERLVLEGNLQLIAEATPELVGKLAARFPRFSQLFTHLRVPAPEREVLIELLEKLPLTPAAVRTLIALMTRFEPYSGMPGVAVRFVDRMLENRAAGAGPVSEAELRTAYAQRSGLPDWIIHPERTIEAAELHRALSERVFGQERAVTAAVDALKRLKTNLAPVGRPVANFLFMGPTGVGKTELARQIARQIFGDPDRLLRFDLSEYAQPGSEQRLYGGEVNGRLLTDPVRLQPFRVLLFDELEKADRSFHNLLLQILDSGRLTDDRDRTVSFAGCVIVMTSNIGHGTNRRGTVRLGNTTDAVTEERQRYERALRAALPAEIVGRMEHLVVFDALDAPTIRRIVDHELNQIGQLPGLRERQIDLSISEAARGWLGKRGFDARYGARYLQRTLRAELLIPLANALTAQEDTAAVRVDVQPEADRLAFEIDEPDSLTSMMDLMRQREEQITLDELAKLHRELLEFPQSQQGSDLRYRLARGDAQREGKPDPRWEEQRARFAQILNEARSIQNVIQETEETYFLQRLRREPLQPDPAERYAELRHQVLDWRRTSFGVLHPDAEKNVQFSLTGRGAQRAFDFLKRLTHAAGLRVDRDASLYLPAQSQNWNLTPEELKEQVESHPVQIMNLPREIALLGFRLTLKGSFANLFLQTLTQSERRLYFRDEDGWSWAEFSTSEHLHNPYLTEETPEQHRWRIVFGEYFHPQLGKDRLLNGAEVNEDFFKKLAALLRGIMDEQILG